VAVRDDDVASGMMGIDVVRTKATAFLLGAFYAGIGGGLWAYYVRFVAVDQFTLLHSIWFIAMIIVGGMGSVTGALIGVVVIKLAQEGITTLGPFAGREAIRSQRRCRVRGDERVPGRHHRRPS
jgi:branched-chain amino acid transport system permease protein